MKVRHKGPAPYLFLSPYLLLTAIFFVFPFVNADHARVLRDQRPAQPRLRRARQLPLPAARPQLPHRAAQHDDLRAGVGAGAAAAGDGAGAAAQLGRLAHPRRVPADVLLAQPGRPGARRHPVLGAVHAALRPDHARHRRAAALGDSRSAGSADPPLVMPAIVLSSLWLWVGFNMIYFLAALQTVDKSLEEAARIDGASPWQVFWHVTLPSMRHVVVFVVIMSIIGSYQLFELPITLLSETQRLRRQERRADADHLPQLLRLPVGRPRPGVGRRLGGRGHHLHHQPDPDPGRQAGRGLDHELSPARPALRVARRSSPSTSRCAWSIAGRRAATRAGPSSRSARCWCCRRSPGWSPACSRHARR